MLRSSEPLLARPARPVDQHALVRPKLWPCKELGLKRVLPMFVCGGGLLYMALRASSRPPARSSDRGSEVGAKGSHLLRNLASNGPPGAEVGGEAHCKGPEPLLPSSAHWLGAHAIGFAANIHLGSTNSRRNPIP